VSELIDRKAFHRYMKPARIIAEVADGFVCRRCWSSNIGVRLDAEAALYVVCLKCGMSIAVTEETFEDGSQ